MLSLFRCTLAKRSALCPDGVIKMSVKMFTNESMKIYDTLSIYVPEPFVFHVALNRQEKRNAMNHQMWMDIRTCFQSMSANEDCRVVILSGSGSTFCSGIDIQSFMGMATKLSQIEDIARKTKLMRNYISDYQDCLTSIEKCAKPVLCAVHGACIGGGLDMITATDVRYCSKDAWFQVKEVDIGMAADVGTLQRLPRIIGPIARELIFTGRKFDSDYAKQLGLVSQIFDSQEKLLEETVKVAAEIASKSPVAVQTAKSNLLFSQDHTIQEGLDHIADLNSTMLLSEDFMKAVIAQASKDPKQPVFSKL